MRKENLIKKGLAIALSSAMVLGVMPGLGKMDVKAAPATVKDINLGTAGFSAPISTESSGTPWTGSKVYYGNKLWRVLDPSHDSDGNNTGDSAFLFSEELQGTKAYNDEGISITWENCTLRKYLNGTGNVGGDGTFLGDTFTEK